MPHTPRYTPGEEIANCVTHGIGAVLSIAGLAVLVAFAARQGDAWHVAGCSIFGGTLILLYTASALYHGIPNPGAKPVLRALDHAAIFLLIAGTYTPFLLVSLRGPWGWSLLAVIWCAGIAGILLRVALRGRRHGLVVGFYVAMGCTALVATGPLLASLGPRGMGLLAAGGAAYLGGIVFYLWRRLPYGHAIWHGCVLLGSALHFLAVLWHVIPWPATA